MKELLPLIFIVGLQILFKARQSPHPWNTAWQSTAKYFPTDGKSLIDASFLQVLNWEYAENKYGAVDAKDFYFTNQEVFKGASTVLEAIRANPKFVFKQWWKHIKNLKWMIIRETSIPMFWDRIVRFLRLPVHGGVVLYPPLILSIIYKALKQSGNERSFILGCMMAIIPTIFLGVPKSQYMGSLIPVFTVGASCWKNIIPLVLLSNGLRHWTDTKHGYMMQSFKKIESIIANCQGVMALEHKFLGAFSNLPREKIYDVWEIPPYGRLHESEYDGLRPERIDCLLISNELQTGRGSGTNFAVRYQNYIQPYMEELLSMGASSIDIPGYGRAVILNRKSPLVSL